MCYNGITVIKRLKNITNIQMGFTFRSKIESASKGIRVIQMRDLTNDNRVSFEESLLTENIDVKESHMLIKDDILFRSRGYIFNSAIVSMKPEKTVAASPLVRIRIIDTKTVMPEYLLWFLNENKAQSYFNKCQEGTAQKMVSIGALKELELNIPSIEKQKSIIEISSLRKKEKDLSLKLFDLKDKYISGKLQQYAKEQIQ
jgi:restriction endonuclease S subunit